MRILTVPIVILLLVVLSAPATVLAAINTVPRAGTVFLGEQGLDITASGATPGSQIVWYGPGGTQTSVPASTMTVDDPSDFYISPVLFGDKTGPWFIIPGNSLAFYVQDPLIEIRVIDETRDFQITNEVTWIPKGDVVGFRVDTNVYEIAKRPGSPGAPIDIRIRGPSGVEYSSIDGYSLDEIMISVSPFQTGPVWFTGDYESGKYVVWAESTGNDMNLNYKREGKTITTPVDFLLQSTNPLITPSLTTVPATISTVVPHTTVQKTVPATTVTSPTMPPVTDTLPVIPTTTAPGFGVVISLSAFAAGIIILTTRRK